MVARRLTAAPVAAMLSFVLLGTTGCWAPLRSHGIPACTLPDTFRTPIRTAGPPLNLAALAIPPQPEYYLGPGDVLEVMIHGLYPGGEIRPVRTQVMADGKIHLPVVGAVRVDGMNLTQAHLAINRAYADGYINEPRTNVYLLEKASVAVLVLGEVGAPGLYTLPKGENDVAHALAAGGGLMEDAALEIEVHRRIPPEQVKAMRYYQWRGQLDFEAGTTVEFIDPPDGSTPQDPPMEILPSPDPITRLPQPESGPNEPNGPDAVPSALGKPLMHEPMRIVKIPLRGHPTQPVFTSDIVLQAGDVVMVPSRKDEVFYVVGKLSPTNFVRFSISERERDIGAGFLLPRDREIDVVTAVAMAGYIDPIDSPTTVTVHRHFPDGRTMLILVDLIKARYDTRETVLVSAGDIIYLNPDSAWWFRRTFDRWVVDLLSISYRQLINGGN